MTRRAAVPQADIERTIRALKAVGETIMGVERRLDGSFVVLTGANPPPKPLTPLQAWELEHGDCAA